MVRILNCVLPNGIAGTSFVDVIDDIVDTINTETAKVGRTCHGTPPPPGMWLEPCSLGPIANVFQVALGRFPHQCRSSVFCDITVSRFNKLFGHTESY